MLSITISGTLTSEKPRELTCAKDVPATGQSSGTSTQDDDAAFLHCLDTWCINAYPQLDTATSFVLAMLTKPP